MQSGLHTLKNLCDCCVKKRLVPKVIYIQIWAQFTSVWNSQLTLCFIRFRIRGLYGKWELCKVWIEHVCIHAVSILYVCKLWYYLLSAERFIGNVAFLLLLLQTPILLIHVYLVKHSEKLEVQLMKRRDAGLTCQYKVAPYCFRSTKLQITEHNHSCNVNRHYKMFINGMNKYK